MARCALLRLLSSSCPQLSLQYTYPGRPHVIQLEAHQLELQTGSWLQRDAQAAAAAPALTATRAIAMPSAHRQLVGPASFCYGPLDLVQRCQPVSCCDAYSHSVVAGGLGEMSKATRAMPSILVICGRECGAYTHICRAGWNAGGACWWRSARVPHMRRDGGATASRTAETTSSTKA